METAEILNKIAELKELAKKAEELAFEIHSEVVAKKIDSNDEISKCMDKGSEFDKAEYVRLVQENARYANMCSCIETATYKLTEEVIGNLNKIA